MAQQRVPLFSKTGAPFCRRVPGEYPDYRTSVESRVSFISSPVTSVMPATAIR